MSGLLITGARLATMREGRYSVIERGALRIVGDRIDWIGAAVDAPANSRDERVDAGGALVTPGLIDCHTHLVYAGNRAAEFERRQKGATYEEIAREGGGILSTVRATRAASEEQLERESRVRLDALVRGGVTTVEVKSGYGLDLENELKCLRVARKLGAKGVRVVTTLLAAHSVPPEFKDRGDAYVEHVCREIIPAAARDELAAAVDAFCERIAFTPAQTRRIFESAREHGLRVKLHADQLSNSGGAALAAEFNALSADHLEHTDDAGVEALSRARVVAVLLPGAFYYLRETRKPPIAALRRHQVPIAIASDCNPGTSPIASPGAILNMACTLFGLVPEEALAGVTFNAARALGIESMVGSLETGKRADLAIWDVEHPAEIAAQIGIVAPRAVYFGGQGVLQ